MGQIVKRKKKGRPSKADLARRAMSAAEEAEKEVRRSLRRRNVRYDIDYYEEYFDDETDDEEDERRREKKLKLVLKLNQGRESAEPARSRSRSLSRVEHVSDDDDDEEDKPLKKRKISGADESGSEGEDNYEDEEERGRREDEKGQDLAPGTPSDHPSEYPLPEKKTLELILDKLQKKDTYGVYAEPVDPEELPDYHDIIEHPMDFATVRKKLANGSYSTLEQFESDVFLICSNAMQYNAPDTIYHKQARAIEEQAKKKFHRVRLHLERAEREAKLDKELNKEKELKSEKEPKSEQKPKSNFLPKKQAKKPLNRAMQEPLSSDFSSGATLATAGDIHNGSVAIQAGGCERPNNNDVLVEVNTSFLDSNLEKVEELSSGRGILSKFGRKLCIDENRRGTYNISTQPEVKSESIFTTFGSEIKQLVAVGLHAEYSYARSLARFAAALGPVAWKVASKRIEQALPAGYKFGRGWVGEYEPLPTPVLMLETTHRQKESAAISSLTSTADVGKDEKACKTPVPSNVDPASHSFAEGNSSFFRPANVPKEGKVPFFSSAGTKPSTPVSAVSQQQNPFSRTPAEPNKKLKKQVELNMPPSANQNNGDPVVGKQQSKKFETALSKSSAATPSNMNLLQSLPPKQLNDNGFASGGALPNGKMTSNSGNGRVISPSSDSVTNQAPRSAGFFQHGQEPGLNDPVQLRKLLNERARKQQESSSNQSTIHTLPVMSSAPSIKREDSSNAQSTIHTLPVMSSAPSIKREDSNNAAVAAARAWMSIGTSGFKPPNESSSSPKNQILAESLYNPSREFPSQISQVRGQFPISAGSTPFNGFPIQAFVPPNVRASNEAQFQNRQPMGFPQLGPTDLSRFQQMQSSWRGLSPHTQTQPVQKQRNEALPPDLNISFQSPGSPVKQSQNAAVDSQQPDLALQL